MEWLVEIDGYPAWHSRDTEADSDHQILSPVLDLQVNKAGEFKCKLPRRHPMADRVEPGVTQIRIYRDHKLHWRGRVYRQDRDLFGTLELEAEGALSFFRDTLAGPWRFNEITPTELLNRFILDHNAQVGGSRKMSLGFVDPQLSATPVARNIEIRPLPDTLSAMIARTAESPLGGFIKLTGANLDQVSWVKQSGADAEQVLEYGDNLASLQLITSAAKIRTAVEPFGMEANPGKNDYLTLNPAHSGVALLYTDTGGTPHYGVVDTELEAQIGRRLVSTSHPETKTAETLLAVAQRELNTRRLSSFTIDASAVDLAVTDVDVDALNLGDYVRVHVPHLKLDERLPVTRMRINLSDNTGWGITLGEERATLAKRTADLTHQINHMQGQYREVGATAERALREALHAGEQVDQKVLPLIEPLWDTAQYYAQPMVSADTLNLPSGAQIAQVAGATRGSVLRLNNADGSVTDKRMVTLRPGVLYQVQYRVRVTGASAQPLQLGVTLYDKDKKPLSPSPVALVAHDGEVPGGAEWTLYTGYLQRATKLGESDIKVAPKPDDPAVIPFESEYVALTMHTLGSGVEIDYGQIMAVPTALQDRIRLAGEAAARAIAIAQGMSGANANLIQDPNFSSGADQVTGGLSLNATAPGHFDIPAAHETVGRAATNAVLVAEPKAIIPGAVYHTMLWVRPSTQPVNATVRLGWRIQGKPDILSDPLPIVWDKFTNVQFQWRAPLETVAAQPLISFEGTHAAWFLTGWHAEDVTAAVDAADEVAKLRQQYQTFVNETITTLLQQQKDAIVAQVSTSREVALSMLGGLMEENTALANAVHHYVTTFKVGEQSIRMLFDQSASVTNAVNQLETWRKSEQTWINFSDQGIDMGKSGTGYRMHIDEDELTFYEGAVKLATFTNQHLEVKHLKALESEAVGWMRWRKGSRDGLMVLVRED